MHNIATIYRFNTPFLDISKERDSLVSVIKKIEKSIEFDGMKFKKIKKQEGNYFKITLKFEEDLGKIEFFYISKVALNIYHLPIFKLNIFLAEKFLLTNESKQKTVKFLNNIFECFDGLSEKEFLIDLDNSLYYKKSWMGFKYGPNYDFSDIEVIRESFEAGNGIKQMEDFIKKFSNSEFILTYSKSEYFHKLHGIFLYFIYLVFLMYQNLEKTSKAKKELETVISEEIYEIQAGLMKERLAFVEKIHLNTFNQYKKKLELFFNLF